MWGYNPLVNQRVAKLDKKEGRGNRKAKQTDTNKEISNHVLEWTTIWSMSLKGTKSYYKDPRGHWTAHDHIKPKTVSSSGSHNNLTS